LAAFTPASLFAAGDQGVFFDPSDFSSLAQDAAGTTPVTALEQPVGLMLDKSKGLVLGPELTSGEWSNSGLIPFDSFSASGSEMTATKTVSGTPKQAYLGSFAIEAGKSYYVELAISANTFSSNQLQIGLSTSTTQRSTATVGILSSGASTIRGYLFAASTQAAAQLRIASISASTGSISVTSATVRELPGNHASQPTATSRPVVSSRVNLLTKTEQFDDAAWVLAGSINPGAAAPVRTSYTGTLPSGATGTIYRFSFPSITAANAFSIAYQVSSLAQQASVDYKPSIYIKRVSGGTKLPLLIESSSAAPTAGGYVSSVLDVTDEWKPYSYSSALTGTVAGNLTFMFGFDGRISSNRDLGAIVVDVWGADLRVANDGVGIPPYQRVNTATDYDSTGFPVYLRADGVDDGMVTNSIDFTATDKMTVVAGVRKLSDATGMVVQLGFTFSDPGSFGLYNFASDSKYYFASKGSSGVIANPNTLTRSAPVSSVLTATNTISGDAAKLRFNGAQEGESLVDQGAGNYTNAQMYICRGPTGFPFNGRFYGLTIVNKLLSTAELEQLETYVNSKTRAFA
jgi:hypothetical protein